MSKCELYLKVLQIANFFSSDKLIHQLWEELSLSKVSDPLAITHLLLMSIIRIISKSIADSQFLSSANWVTYF